MSIKRCFQCFVDSGVYKRVVFGYWLGQTMAKHPLAWILIAIMLILLVTARENIPAWLAEYNREAARGNNDLEWLPQP